MWALHHLEQQPRRRQTGELRHAKVRHAGDTPPEGFAWRKTPTATSTERAAGAEGQAGAPVGGESPATAHTIRCHAKQISPSTSRTAQLPVENSPSTPPRTACAGQNSPCTPALAACAGQNSPCTPALAAFPVQNSPCTPEMAQFGAFYACRESFIPLSPPRSQAGRILYRTQGRDEARQHNSTPGPTCVEGAGGTGVEGTGGTGGHGRASRHRAWPRCRWAVVEPGRSTHKQQQHPAQTNFARNFRRSFFETAQKRCNSNEVISMFEVITGELRAKLLCGRAAAHGAARPHTPTGGAKRES